MCISVDPPRECNRAWRICNCIARCVKDTVGGEFGPRSPPEDEEDDDAELRLGEFGSDGGDELLEEADLARPVGVEGLVRRRSPSLLLDDGLL